MPMQSTRNPPFGTAIFCYRSRYRRKVCSGWIALAFYRKHRRVIVAILAAVLLSSALFFLQQRSSKPTMRTVRIGFDENPPVHFSESNGSIRGYAVDVFNEAARRQGIILEWVRAPEHADSALAS